MKQENLELEHKLERKVVCNFCQKLFIQKWVVSSKNWSNINRIGYWMEESSTKLVCRLCLKSLLENKNSSFRKLVSIKKMKLFNTYKGSGVFDKDDKI